MQNIIDKYISEKSEKGILLELHELGLSQTEVENFILEKFKPYFKRETIPRAQLISYLHQYVDSLIIFTSTEETKVLLDTCLETYWKAKEKNSAMTYKSFQYWQNDILEATSKIISLINMDQDRGKMNLHEFTEDLFIKIGKIIEACIKPHLRILLYLEKIIAEEMINVNKLNGLSLGKIVNLLLEKPKYQGLLVPDSWKWKLNDWRNIANHEDFRISNNWIVCGYKKLPKGEVKYLVKAELWKLFNEISDRFSILRLTHSIFFMDNLEEIKPYWKNLHLRRESYILDIISLYNVYGFSVLRYSIENDIVEFDLKDTRKRNYKSILDLLIFLIRPTWYKTRKRFIKLNYQDFNGILIYEINADTFKKKELFKDGVAENLITIDNIRDCLIIRNLL